MRRGADIGDLIFGCGSKTLDLVGRAIFAMRVAEKLTFQQYWDDPRFFRKRPVFTAGRALAFGDNIYHRDQGGKWIQEDSHHSLPGGAWNALNADRDLGADAVLIGTEFVYWGSLAPQIPQELRDCDGDDLYPNVRDVRNHYSDVVKAAALAWFDDSAKGRLGRPVNWKK
jgi:hypothetical protein